MKAVQEESKGGRELAHTSTVDEHLHHCIHGYTTQGEWEDDGILSIEPVLLSMARIPAAAPRVCGDTELMKAVPQFEEGLCLSHNAALYLASTRLHSYRKIGVHHV